MKPKAPAGIRFLIPFRLLSLRDGEGARVFGKAVKRQGRQYVIGGKVHTLREAIETIANGKKQSHER